MAIPQIKYRATFADGTVKTRKTDRTYTHAWKVIHGRGGVTIGYSGSAELARQAAAQRAKWQVGSTVEVVAVEITNPEVLPIREKLIADAHAAYDAAHPKETT
jgi:hypothetical protein